MNPYQEFIDSPDFHKEDCINLMTFPACAIKVETTAAIKEFVESYNQIHEVKIHYPMGNEGSPKSYMEALRWVEDPNRYPDVILACDFKSLFAPNFRKFQEQGLFTDVLKDTKPHSFYETFDYKDPKETYSMLGASFSVIVFDKSVDSNLPVPTSFKDLLDPIYEKKISIHGHGDDSCDMTIVVNIYEQYGKAAALTFAKAINELRHFSKVVKEAGKGNKSLPPISIIPENFGYLLRNRKNIEVIWPQDGSPVFPLLMTVKKEKADQAKELIDYLSGPELGQYWGDSHFASFNQNVENKAYQGKPIRYLGWDFVYDKDILEFRESLEEEVLEIVRGYPMDKKEKVQRIC